MAPKTKVDEDLLFFDLLSNQTLIFLLIVNNWQLNTKIDGYL